MRAKVCEFLDNKYCRWYFEIINTAKRRRIRVETERHHIIPKCFGGTDEASNIVHLSYREHFLVHWLLPKFTEGHLRYKMLSALWQMARVPRHYTRITASWQYAVARKAVSEVTAARNVGNQYSKGYKWTVAQHEAHRQRMELRSETPMPEEWREKIRQRQIGKVASEETKRKMGSSQRGRKHSEESKKKISAGNKGKVRSAECRENLRRQKLGKKLSVETRKRMSRAHQARHRKRTPGRMLVAFLSYERNIQ